MGFWKNIDDELKFRGISRKELAFKIEMKEQSLHKAIERDSEASAIMALKAAKFLEIPLESLLELEEVKTENHHISSEAQRIAMDYTKLSTRDKELIHFLIKKMKE